MMMSIQKGRRGAGMPMARKRTSGELVKSLARGLEGN